MTMSLQNHQHNFQTLPLPPSCWFSLYQTTKSHLRQMVKLKETKEKGRFKTKQTKNKKKKIWMENQIKAQHLPTRIVWVSRVIFLHNAHKFQTEQFESGVSQCHYNFNNFQRWNTDTHSHHTHTHILAGRQAVRGKQTHFKPSLCKAYAGKFAINGIVTETV